ncbi:uncharacterized protein LOC118273351 isoform X4 [Spodoptera frugiperda]|uniref:receptor protein-tyrosine kinase n=1 Tax=Spodoptera frugiperda TaxID=7108 RepID=A0A9R0DV80_SPOFR|nr:uncharacterized protein LOC118273351 isoform X4 [Spodoptera frugiperda]
MYVRAGGGVLTPPAPPPVAFQHHRLISAHMTRFSRWWGVVLGLCALAAAAAGAGAADEVSRPVGIMAVTLDGPGDSGAALGALAAAALAARGVRAAAAPVPAACGPGGAGPSSLACRNDVLRALVLGKAQAALLPVPAARPPHVLKLRDVGLTELGDAVPASRLACFVSPPTSTATFRPPQSLLDFSDETVAMHYGLPSDDISAVLRGMTLENSLGFEHLESNCFNFNSTPEWCSAGARSCATLITDNVNDARLLATVVRDHRLLARVLAPCLLAPHDLAPHDLAPHDLASWRRPMPHALLLCSRTSPGGHFSQLASPPCDTSKDICVFDPYRLMKIVNERELQSPSTISVLGRLELTETELHDFLGRYRASGSTVAIAEMLKLHSKWTGPPGEARTAVMLPMGTSREAFDSNALKAAALLAEEDSKASETVSFKVQLLDDKCASTLAFKYLTDALGAEFGALSGVAGPACGAAFADVARQGPTLAMPVLAYTPQAPPPAPAAAWALLAAGDARLYSGAWAAFMAHVGWRRVAVLSELATRAALDVADLAADVLVHVELSADTDDLDLDKILQWAARAAAAQARILYVCAEDARVVRAALCAGRAAGLAPAAGAVWLLPASLPRRWLRAPAGNCTQQELRDMAEGHLSVAPAWMADWEERGDAPADSEVGAWQRSWRARCSRWQQCGRAPAQAALLYDALRMWDAALRRALRAHPAALDNLHHKSIARALIEDVTTSSYNGLTGKFEWSGDASGARARLAPVVVQQWSNGTRLRLGAWSRAAGYRAGPRAPRWRTPDGRAPDDGAPHCALQALADVLRADCRAAVLALAALALAALLGASAAAACHYKRRAERKYRARLAALGLARLDPKPGGLDRWEIPRERVVINRKLGTGAFGTVYGGHALLAEDRGWSAVAVKTLKAGATTEEKLDFLSEAEAMKRFDHKNVVRLLGVVTKTEPVCTVMEFMLYGDLKNYLLARRHLAAGAGAGEADEVSAARLTAMALDAARGLSYLAQLRYVHRDVAARNCLVSAQRVVKLADFGMTRLVFEHDYYRFSRKGMLPVRWMAPESLALGVFSPASDVWSFGVLLYEIVTFGSLPFQGLSNAEVLARVKAGHTLELPPGLKPQLEGLIRSCWQAEQRARPGAAEVAAFLADCPRLLAPCLDLPLDALPLDLEPWQTARDRAESRGPPVHMSVLQARWVSWGAPASAGTDTTYLSADAPPADTDAFLS